MSLGVAVFTILPPVMDLMTKTHVFHEGWLPHARLHAVWLIGVTTGIGLISLYFLWLRKTDPRFNINLAGLLSSIVLGTFFLSVFSAPLYDGAVVPIDRAVNAGPFGFDGNAFVFGIATLLLILGWIVSTWKRT